MMRFFRIIQYCIFSLLISTIIGRSDEKVLEDAASPDKTKSLLSKVSNIDKPENPTIVELRYSNKVVWSKTFTARYIHFYWSPASRCALIDVRHYNEGTFSKQLYLLDSDKEPTLFDLRFDVIDASINKRLNPNEAFDFGSSPEGAFGFRAGGYDVDDGVWLKPQVFKFEYDYETETVAAVAEIILKISQDSLPVLSVSNLYQAKNCAELDRILSRVRTDMRNY